MPHDVKKQITAQELREHDRMIEVDGAPIGDDDPLHAPVVRLDKKQTWGYVTFADRERQTRIKLNMPLVVLRSEPTDEEKLAGRHEMIREELADELTKLLTRRPDALLEDVIAKKRNAASEHNVLDSWTLTEVLQVQALHKLGLRIRSYLTPNVTDATYDELITAFATWYANDVNRGSWLASVVRDPLSRSTSTVTNLLEDLDAWAPQKLLGSFALSVASSAIIERAARLRDEWNKNSHWT